MPSPALPPVVLRGARNKISHFQCWNSWSTSTGMPLLQPRQLSLYLRGTSMRAHTSNPTKNREHALSAARHEHWWNMQQDRDWQTNGFILHVFLCFLCRRNWLMTLTNATVIAVSTFRLIQEIHTLFVTETLVYIKTVTVITAVFARCLTEILSRKYGPLNSSG